MEWFGTDGALLRFGASKEEELFVVRFQDGRLISFEKKVTFESEKNAKNALIQHCYFNFAQGHYWHKDTGNTFEQYAKYYSLKAHRKGYEGYAQSEEQMEKNAKDLADYLLERGIFKIEPIK